MNIYRHNDRPPVEPLVVRHKTLTGGTIVRVKRRGNCRCTEPGLLFSLWYWITGRDFVKGDLWRCRHGFESRYLGDGVWTDLKESVKEEE